MELRWTAAFCILSFICGFFQAGLQQDETLSVSSFTAVPVENGLRDTTLQRQEQAHTCFQEHIHNLQQPDRCQRMLTVHPSRSAVGANFMEQFAREFQYLALSLQVAVATDRVMVLADNWKLLTNTSSSCTKYEMSQWDLQGSLLSIACLGAALTVDCAPVAKSLKGQVSSKSRANGILNSSSAAFGIITDVVVEKGNSLFHAQFYGPEGNVDMPSWPYPMSSYLIDVVPQMERAWGRFWVRSQMVHFLWNQWHASSTNLRSLRQPSIAVYWTSSKQMQKNLAAKYGRNATVTQSMNRYMAVANRIRKKHEPMLETIHLVFDGTDALDRIEEKWPDWTFIRHAPEQPFNEQDVSTLAALTVLQEATYLVGSFQSQLFRLAAELNTAFHSNQYPAAKRRHWTVDVEWFESP